MSENSLPFIPTLELRFVKRYVPDKEFPVRILQQRFWHPDKPGASEWRDVPMTEEWA